LIGNTLQNVKFVNIWSHELTINNHVVYSQFRSCSLLIHVNLKYIHVHLYNLKKTKTKKQ